MLEQPLQLNITQTELASRVADYFDTLLAQRDMILARYGLTPETAEQFCDIHTSDEDREIILALYENMVYVLQNKRMPPHIKQEKYRMAQEIMSKEFFGIEAIEKTFNIHLDLSDIPDIPFSLKDLDTAKDLNQFLILRVDKTDDGTPLTMEHMEALLADTFEKEGDGKIFYPQLSYRADDGFIQETPRLSWALVSKGNIPGSTEKNYLQQTERLVDYLKKEIFEGGNIPEPWQSAILEFEQKKDDIHDILFSNPQEAAQQLEALKITSLSRHTPVEVLYDCLVYFRNTKGKERLWENDYVWTGRCRGSGDRLVYLGRFYYGGAFVRSLRPDYPGGNLGVSFSRLR